MLTTGVLGTLAVLMTRNPDMPLGAPPPRRLSVPIHFAPVTGSQSGPCATPEGVPDDTGQTCYTLAGGVSVTAVHKIETVLEKSGAYSVRIAFAPAFRDQINDLTQEAVKQQIAIVVGEKVVAAPRVAQVITEDSLSIAGSFTKEQADAMVARLRGAVGAVTPSPGQSPQVPVSPPTASDQPVPPPATTGTTPPGTVPTGTVPTGTAATTGTTTGTTTGATTGATTGTTTGTTPPAPTAAPTAAARGGQDGEEGDDPRYSDCKAAAKEGYGPYYREQHKEYKWYIDKDNDGVACDSGDMV
ncbi:SecDF P1 head subdomain-containing protein [Streptosporangium canum]|uniref:SecDF P1 head subdomain-containing protein n=1 Tax=Streptosporangium canum TaxID=324952 RepID=UPI0033AEA966